MSYGLGLRAPLCSALWKKRATAKAASPLKHCRLCYRFMGVKFLSSLVCKTRKLSLPPVCDGHVFFSWLLNSEQSWTRISARQSYFNCPSFRAVLCEQDMNMWKSTSHIFFFIKKMFKHTENKKTHFEHPSAHHFNSVTYDSATFAFVCLLSLLNHFWANYRYQDTWSLSTSACIPPPPQLRRSCI